MRQSLALVARSQTLCRQSRGKIFLCDKPPHLERNDLRIEVPHINHPDVIKVIDKHNPDLIVVFGTSLLKGELLEKGRLGIINLHGGLSPEYRGADCTFWALHNQEPEKVGCTIHYINAGIDTGNIIAHVSPEIKETDDELTLFWRAVRDSTIPMQSYSIGWRRVKSWGYTNRKRLAVSGQRSRTSARKKT